jgi:hypothetical protein
VTSRPKPAKRPRSPALRRFLRLIRAGRVRVLRSGPKVRIAMTSPTKQDRYRARASTLQIVIDALIQQAMDYRGLTKEEAKAEMADLMKRRAAMDKALVNWAWWYLNGEELQKPR